MKVRNSAKALIVRDGKLLAMKKEDKDGDYYILVGGGQKHGETLHQAVKRECFEEAGIEVEPGELLLMREYIGKLHEHAAFDSHRHQIDFMFHCTPLTEPDLAKATEQDDGQIGFEWLPLATIEDYRLYPRGLRRAIREVYLEGKPQAVYQGSIN